MSTAMEPSRGLMAALEFFNLYRWVVWTRGYKRAIPARDYHLQLVLSVLATALTLFLIVEGLAAQVGVPMVTLEQILYPDPTTIMRLFSKAVEGTVASVTCTCSNLQTKLSAVSTWNATEDSLCPAIREFVSFSPDNFNLLNDQRNDFCIGTPGVPGTDLAWDAFLANITDTIVTPGDLFAGSTPAELDEYTYNLAIGIQRGLCGLAFGSRQQNLGGPLGGSGFPFRAAPSDSGLQNMCPSGIDNFFVPPIFVNSAFSANFVRVQQTRARALLQAASSLCFSLLDLRSSFLEAVRDVPLVTPLALSPSDLASAVERAWFDALKSSSTLASSSVPGAPSGEDPLAAFTGAGGSGSARFPRQDLPGGSISPPIDLSLGAFPFSSRLPLYRTDFLTGASTVYFVTAFTADTLEPVPVLAGNARVRADTAPGLFPYVQTRSPDIGNHATPGFVPGVTQNWVPLGDDFLSVLDTCASGLPLSIDVHNLRPLDVPARFDSARMQPP